MDEVFQSLRRILNEHESELEVVKDTAAEYYLNSKVKEKGKPVFFGMVKVSKSKIAFHLMPVYCHPELLDDLSPDLKKRMQGKSCFNFSKVENELFDELRQLTERGFKLFQNDGRI